MQAVNPTQELLKAGGDVNARRVDRNSVVMTAVKNVRNSAVIDELLTAGAKITAVNNFGHTALMMNGEDYILLW